MHLPPGHQRTLREDCDQNGADLHPCERHSPPKPGYSQVHVPLVLRVQAAAASRYELLYKDATHRQRKQQDLAASLPEEYTFTPRLQTRRPHPSAGAPVSERSAPLSSLPV